MYDRTGSIVDTERSCAFILVESSKSISLRDMFECLAGQSPRLAFDVVDRVGNTDHTEQYIFS